MILPLRLGKNNELHDFYSDLGDEKSSRQQYSVGEFDGELPFTAREPESCASEDRYQHSTEIANRVKPSALEENSFEVTIDRQPCVRVNLMERMQNNLQEESVSKEQLNVRVLGIDKHYRHGLLHFCNDLAYRLLLTQILSTLCINQIQFDIEHFSLQLVIYSNDAESVLTSVQNAILRNNTEQKEREALLKQQLQNTIQISKAEQSRLQGQLTLKDSQIDDLTTTLKQVRSELEEAKLRVSKYETAAKESKQRAHVSEKQLKALKEAQEREKQNESQAKMELRQLIETLKGVNGC